MYSKRLFATAAAANISNRLPSVPARLLVKYTTGSNVLMTNSRVDAPLLGILRNSRNFSAVTSQNSQWNQGKRNLFSRSRGDSRCSAAAIHVKDSCTPFRLLHKSHMPCKMRDSIPDLQRFLSEIGTDPKEARYWLKQFLNVNQKKPFAVVEVDPQIFEQSEQLEHLASSVSFLQRNALRPVLVIGETPNHPLNPQRSLQELKAASTARSCMLSDALHEQGLESCILFPGSQVIDVDSDSKCNAKVKQVNPDLIQWCMMRQAVPIIPSFGETSLGQTVPLTLWDVTSMVTKQLQPLKVIRVNCHGGFKDDKKQVIANISLPFDSQAAQDKAWCTNAVLTTISEVSSLLCQVPESTSVVITAADTVLQELFTHHGSGTFLKITEPILKHQSFEEVDVDRLKTLLSKSFKKSLSDTYFDDVRHQIHTIYLSERFTAAAVILCTADCDVPYLCKFAVSAQAQGEGVGDILWEAIRRDYKQLFWRSRENNPINPWYFKKSEGSWSNGKWTVFWYGIPEPVLSTALINKAISAPESFCLPEASTRQPETASSV
ncbi:N-acetylglutamate synthase, mitochondrial-like [Littorina saxatilis]|uniref:N-acetyltransferase domain-containing protein n=1 Tax=Littorina saxatilis TaxID=31220 RepID=A0AAN9BWZ3_9CAEN